MLPLYGGVDYNSEIQPIFNSRCTNCHSGSDAEEDLSLTSYNNVCLLYTSDAADE